MAGDGVDVAASTPPPRRVERRKVMVEVTIHDGTYPDDGALAAQVASVLVHPKHGLHCIAVDTYDWCDDCGGRCEANAS